MISQGVKPELNPISHLLGSKSCCDEEDEDEIAFFFFLIAKPEKIKHNKEKQNKWRAGHKNKINKQCKGLNLCKNNKLAHT